MLSTLAYATPIINQTSNGNVAPVDSQGWSYIEPSSVRSFGHGFIANTSSLDGAGMYFSKNYNVSDTATFTISLFDSALNVIGTGSFTHASTGWNDVYFADTQVNLGSTYYVFAKANEFSAAMQTYYTPTGPIPILESGTLKLGTFGDGYGINARIFTNDNANTAVPEPSSIAMMGIGMFALAGLRRRKAPHTDL